MWPIFRRGKTLHTRALKSRAAVKLEGKRIYTTRNIFTPLQQKIDELISEGIQKWSRNT